MIRQLEAADAESYLDLRMEALRDSPLAFSASPGTDLVSSAEALREQLRRGPDWVILGAFDPRLAGAVGLFRDRHPKSSHKVHLWGMYVTPGRRRQGLAAELLRAALRHARALPGVAWVHLSVTSAAPAARSLYEQAGFREWGTEPDALRHAGSAVAEHHMALRLE
jgi:RimJ/RimL family protein N-acetyltransferase